MSYEIDNSTNLVGIMFRCAFTAARCIRPLSVSYLNAARIINSNGYKRFSTINQLCCNGVSNFTSTGYGSLTNNKKILELSKDLAPTQVRTVTKFSLKKGKRKTVKAAVKRFFRLHWGGWIRTRIGRHKKLWTKSPTRKWRLRQHVLVNGTQATLLDKMVTKFWKKPKYYVDDPYAPYHTREEFHITRKKPRPFK